MERKKKAPRPEEVRARIKAGCRGTEETDNQGQVKYKTRHTA